ncbi:unnamed protein product [Camellia sinensis]
MALQNGTLQLLFFIILFLETIKLSSCIENEKQALLKLKQGLTDPSSRLSSWVGENCCTWSGVTCNNKTRNCKNLFLIRLSLTIFCLVCEKRVERDSDRLTGMSPKLLL